MTKKDVLKQLKTLVKDAEQQASFLKGETNFEAGDFDDVSNWETFAKIALDAIKYIETKKV